MNGNHVTLEGNLVQDPTLSDDDRQKLVLRHSANGTAYLRFSLARSFTRNDENVGHFFDCVVFNEQAENLYASATKGMRLIIEGHLSQSKWETEDGQSRSRVELIVDTVAPVLRWASAIVEKNARPDPTPEPAQTTSSELEFEDVDI